MEPIGRLTSGKIAASMDEWAKWMQGWTRGPSKINSRFTSFSSTGASRPLILEPVLELSFFFFLSLSLSLSACVVVYPASLFLSLTHPHILGACVTGHLAGKIRWRGEKNMRWKISHGHLTDILLWADEVKYGWETKKLTKSYGWMRWVAAANALSSSLLFPPSLSFPPSLLVQLQNWVTHTHTHTARQRHRHTQAKD